MVEVDGKKYKLEKLNDNPDACDGCAFEARDCLVRLSKSLECVENEGVWVPE